MKYARIFLRTLRVHQWAKNILCLAGLFFSQNLFLVDVAVKTLICFFSFSFVSSAVYVFNDWIDRDRDKMHSKKAMRPIASGQVSTTMAMVLIVLLLMLGFGLGTFLNRTVIAILAVYVVQNIFYSTLLKQVPLVDVILVSLGFVWRALAGVYAAQVALSPWLVLCTFLLSLFISLAKRKNEATLSPGGSHAHREVLKHYDTAFLDQLLSITASSAIIAYALYCLDEKTVERFHHNLLATLPFVVFGVFRYLLISSKPGVSGDPIESILKDKVLLVATTLWVLLLTILIYFV